MRQRLGQHFLKDQNVLSEIAYALDIGKNDTVIEIGPGHGELTRYLMAAEPNKLILIEKDPALAKSLQDNLYKLASVEVIVGDALEVLPNIVGQFKKESYKLVGNIPYYITGYLMRTIEQIDPRPETTVLTIQKEVAERICSEPPRMNLLAASVQFWGKPKIEFTIKRGSFSPPPEVESALLTIKPLITKKTSNSENYYKLIKILFKQPRKKIVNNLEAGLGLNKAKIAEKLEHLNIDPNKRPQNLSIDEVRSISSEIYP